MRRRDGERLERFAWRKALEPRNEHLDDEAAVRLQVRCGILEAGHLLVLRRQVHDRVRDEVDQGEPILDGNRGEVADGNANLPGARLTAEPRDHCVGQFDPVHLHTPLRER